MRRLFCGLLGVVVLSSALVSSMVFHEVSYGEDYETYDVTEYGADGKDRSDDSAAIQKCLDFAKEKGGAVVVIPEGNYYLDNSLTIYSNTSLVLDKKAVMIRVNGEKRMINTNAINDESKGGYNLASNILIEGGVWDGNSEDTTKQGTPMWFVHSENITLRDFTIKNVSGKHMVVLAGVRNATVKNVRFSDAKEYTGKDAKTHYSNEGLSDEENRESYLRSSEALHLDLISRDGNTEMNAFPLDNTTNENVLVENCYFENVFSGVGNHYSLNDSLIGNGLTVRNNRFSDVKFSCINVYSQNGAVIENNNAENVGELARFRNSFDSVMTGNYVTASEESANAVISLQGIRIISCNGISITNNEVYNMGQNGIRVEDSVVSFEKNRITDPAHSGIYMTNTSATVLYNTIENCGTFGICAFDGGTTDIKNNSILKTGKNDGIHVRNTEGVVESNKVSDTASHGIVVDSVKKVSVSDNIVSNAGLSGIKVGNAKSGSVFQNTIYKTGDHGIRSDSAMMDIVSNSISDTKTDGISVVSGSNIGKIQDNDIRNTGSYGISLNASKGEIRKNVINKTGKGGVNVNESQASIVENAISDTEVHGVSLYSSSKAEISDNLITGMKGHGIYVDASEGTVKNNMLSDGKSYGISVAKGGVAVIRDNTVRNVGDHGISVRESQATIDRNAVSETTKYGVSVESADSSEVTNNDIKDTGKTGISISNVTDSLVENNSVSGAVDYGIRLHASAGMIRSNKVQNSTSHGIYIYYGSTADEVSGNVISNVKGHGISLNDSCSGVLSENRIDSPERCGIASTSSELVANNNIICNSGEHGIALYSGSSGKDISKNAVVSPAGYGIVINASNGNVVDNTISSSKKQAFYALGSSTGTVRGNMIKDSMNSALSIAENSDFVIEDNYVDGTELNGVNVKGASATINGNALYNTGENGIYVYENALVPSVTNNYIEKAGSNGIYINAPDNSNERMQISANSIISESGRGIRIDNTSAVSLSKNIIGNCVQQGIRVTGSADVEIDGNSVYDNDSHGIIVNNSRAVEIKSNTSIGNSIKEISVGDNSYGHAERNVIGNAGVYTYNSNNFYYADNVANNDNYNWQSTVNKPDLTYKALVLDKGSHTLNIGVTRTINILSLPQGFSQSDVEWETGDPEVATVNQRGVVKAVGVGNCTITARIKSNDQEKIESFCLVTVNSDVSNVSLDNTTLNIDQGDTEILRATIKPDNSYNKNLTWSSSNTGVATVDPYGRVSGVGSGTAVITVSSQNLKTASCKVTVKPVAKEVKLNKSSLKISEGNTDILTAAITPSGNFDTDIIWSSSNPSSVSVDENGNISAIKAGESVITAKTKVLGLVASCEVSVVARVTGIELNKTLLILDTGDTAKVNADVVPSVADDRSVVWSSENNEVVSIDGDGNVLALSPGETFIKAKTNDQGKEDFCYVKVRGTTVKDGLPGVEYQSKVIGDPNWQTVVHDGKQAGTTGESKIMEAYRIRIYDKETGKPFDPSVLDVKYRGHIQTYGWESPVTNFSVAGRAGEGKRIEALELSLTGTQAKNYDIYYALHVQTYGWLNWAKNGEKAGTASLSKRVEAIRIQIVPKGSAAPKKLGKRDESFIQGSYAKYSSKVIGQDKWLSEVKDGAISGTTGKSLIMEAFKLNATEKVKVFYRGHIQSYGWEKEWRTDGQVSGREGEGKRIEAIEMKLSDADAEKYDIYYCMHVQSIGWLNWAKNSESAGSSNLSRRVEAIAVRILPKGTPAPGKLGARMDCYVAGVPATSATLDKTSASMKVGASLQLKATVKPENVTLTKHVWQSSDKSVATVDSTGKVTAKKKGSATITFTTHDERAKAKCVIKVE